MIKILFANLDKDIQEERCTLPYSVFETLNPDDEVPELVANRQVKFLTLPDEVKNKLTSSIVSEKIKKIGRDFNLQLLQLASISRLIRNYYFGNYKMENFPQILSREMGIDLNTAQEISNMIIREIINDNTEEKQAQASLAKTTLADALRQFPEVGEQLITSNKIKLKNFPEPARPSIKNWLSDYTFNLGYDQHSSIARGNYIFQNENAKVLNAADRQKLSYILKAYDENTEVAVNVNTKQIVFPTSQTTNDSRPTTYNLPQTALNPKPPTPATRYEMPASPAGRQDTNPQDIFEANDEKIDKFFSGHMVRGRQWTDLPKTTDIQQPATNNLPQTTSSLQPVAYNQQPEQNSKPIENVEKKSKKSWVPSGINHSEARPRTSAQPQSALSSAMNYQQTAAPNKLEFSSPQKMPYESQKFAQKETGSAPQDVSAPVYEESTPPQPLRIVPRGMGRGFGANNVPPKNIVNLKE